MANKQIFKIKFDKDNFIKILRNNDLNISRITNPTSNTYCGISKPTLIKAIQFEEMSLRTYQSIMNVVDISPCIIKPISIDKDTNDRSSIITTLEVMKIKNDIMMKILNNQSELIDSIISLMS